MDIDIENLRRSWNIFDIITGRLDVFFCRYESGWAKKVRLVNFLGAENRCYYKSQGFLLWRTAF